jgi:hypothetical protein
MEYDSAQAPGSSYWLPGSTGDGGAHPAAPWEAIGYSHIVKQTAGCQTQSHPEIHSHSKGEISDIFKKRK